MVVRDLQKVPCTVMSTMPWSVALPPQPFLILSMTLVPQHPAVTAHQGPRLELGSGQR